MLGNEPDKALWEEMQQRDILGTHALVKGAGLLVGWLVVAAGVSLNMHTKRMASIHFCGLASAFVKMSAAIPAVSRNINVNVPDWYTS